MVQGAMNELLALAARQGIRVAWRDLGRRNGEYHSSGLIVLNPRRADLTQRVTLAHELGHAHYGHAWAEDPRRHEAQERQADRYAARLLITPMSYARAENLVGHHAGALARELAVTTRLIELWRDQYINLRRTA